MIFRYTILYVHDVRKTLDFYVRAFGQTKGYVSEGGEFGELETGTTKLSFCAIDFMKSLGKEVSTTSPAHPAFELAFETNDIKAALEQALQAGAALVQDITEVPWGQTIAYVSTPDGTLVELCTPVAPNPA